MFPLAGTLIFSSSARGGRTRRWGTRHLFVVVLSSPRGVFHSSPPRPEFLVCSRSLKLNFGQYPVSSIQCRTKEDTVRLLCLAEPEPTASPQSLRYSIDPTKHYLLSYTIDFAFVLFLLSAHIFCRTIPFLRNRRDLQSLYRNNSRQFSRFQNL
jgi:hypothetical protein